MITLILCGGSGTRLWPLSRKYYPKHFYPLFDNVSLFEKTIERNSKYNKGRFLIVTNQDQFDLAKDQTPTNIEAHYILEPIGRNTAPAIALACMSVDPEEVILVLPSDHLITDQDTYEVAIKEAHKLASDGNLVTFGIKPAYPETGFGYIEADGNEVLSFKEKPDLDTAKLYVEAGRYFWNSGMFCFKAGVFLEELKHYSPEVYEKSKIAFNNAAMSDVLKIDMQDMLSIPDISIDYGVMEHSKKVKVVPADLGWSDLGSFDSIYDHLPKDASGNTLTKENLSLHLDSKNNCIISSGRLIATIGVDDLIVIETHDAVLVCKKGKSQEVKKIVDKLKPTQPYLLEKQIKRVYDWGHEMNVWEGGEYRLKELTMKPQSQFFIEGFRGFINVVYGGITASFSNEIQSYAVGQSLTVNGKDIELTNSNNQEARLIITLFR
jgi:mannose-1-phosphate guanylyltransferase